MEEQITIYSYPDMARQGTSCNGVHKNKALYFFDDGWYESELFDSGRQGMIWDMFSLIGTFSSLQVDIWISDVKERLLQKECFFTPSILQSTYSHLRLKQAQGRYLRFRITIKKGKTTCLRGFEIVYPYRSYVELLPQMYQDNEDLQLFMAPIEDTFLALQKEIRQLPQMWNPLVASHEQLIMMLCSLHFDRVLEKDSETLRTLLLHYRKWIKQRGSYEALFFLATTLLKRNVVLYTESTRIYMIAVYHNDEEATFITSLLSSLIAFGVSFHTKWLIKQELEHSYLDIGGCLDAWEDTMLDFANLGQRLWQ